MHHISKHTVIKIKEGNEYAFKEFYNCYSPYIYNLAIRLLKSNLLAEEIVQESFLNIWLNRESIDEEQGIWAFLYVTAKRLCLNQIRNLKNAETYINQLNQEHVQNIQEHLEFKDLEEMLQNRIQELPKKQRVAFELSRIKGYTHKEIATEMGISQHTVKNHITQALSHLRNYLSLSDLTILIFFSLELVL